jgi:hypothetical protein
MGAQGLGGGSFVGLRERPVALGRLLWRFFFSTHFFQFFALFNDYFICIYFSIFSPPPSCGGADRAVGLSCAPECFDSQSSRISRVKIVTCRDVRKWKHKLRPRRKKKIPSDDQCRSYYYIYIHNVGAVLRPVKKLSNRTWIKNDVFFLLSIVSWGHSRDEQITKIVEFWGRAGSIPIVLSNFSRFVQRPGPRFF